MTPHASQHLSAEALDDVLIGLGSAEAHAHLQECSECSTRMRQFQEDVHLFSEASLAWTEARPARNLDIQPARRFSSHSPLFVIPAAGLLVVVISFVVAMHIHHSAISSAPTASVVTDSPEQIEQDNQLMKDVEAAINPDEEFIVSQYHLMENRNSQ